MVHGENDVAKGDFQIDARGSTALVGTGHAEPADHADVSALVAGQPSASTEKWLSEMLKSQRLDPKRFRWTRRRPRWRSSRRPWRHRIEAAKIRDRGRPSKSTA